MLGESHAEERNGRKPQKTKLRKALGTFTQLLCLQSAANRLIPIAHRFLHTHNTAETFTHLQVPHTRCANHRIWTNNIETRKNHLLALWTILRRSDEWPLKPHPTPHITDHSKQQRTFEFTSCAAFSGAEEQDGSRIIKNCPLGCSACVTTLERYVHSARRHSSLLNGIHPRTKFVTLSNMKMNKSEKCPNTIYTRINLSPQFNRLQQGLLYAPANHEEEIKTTRRSKTTLQNRTAEARFFRPHFNVADHEAWRSCARRLCCRAISLSRRPKTMRHTTRWNIKNCSGCWAKTTLKSTMDVNHKKRN